MRLAVVDHVDVDVEFAAQRGGVDRTRIPLVLDNLGPGWSHDGGGETHYDTRQVIGGMTETVRRSGNLDWETRSWNWGNEPCAPGEWIEV